VEIQEPADPGGRPATPPTAPEGAAILGPAHKPGNAGPGPRIMAASTLTGDDVLNAAGEPLGVIEEIMLDVPSGRIAYAVLAAGGFLGMGNKLFAIPWNALALDPDHHCFRLDVSRERLRTAPGFDRQRWPTMADSRWASELHSYYGSRPYWE
jgi:sporulation protein YlmC with PRC-barrel domain